MSRTDVHRPWDVQLKDPYNRHLLYRYGAWPWEMELTPFKNMFCGCALCTGRHWRRYGRRQERREVREMLRAGRWEEASAKRKGSWW
jgi:hypothetical protein